jgi:hypothetical protein
MRRCARYSVRSTGLTYPHFEQLRITPAATGNLATPDTTTAEPATGRIEQMYGEQSSVLMSP